MSSEGKGAKGAPAAHPLGESKECRRANTQEAEIVNTDLKKGSITKK